MPPPGSPVRLSVNGEPRELAAGADLASLLADLGVDIRRVAVAVNGAVIPRAEWDRHALVAGDRIEIITAVGGG